MEQKHAIVTGGGNGIGRVTADLLHDIGWAVSIFDIDLNAGSPFADGSDRRSFFRCDVSNENDVAAGVEAAVERYGRLDLLVNNAGIGDPEAGPMEQLSIETWNRIIDVNLTGVFLCSRYATPHLVRESGVIINIASTRAIMSEPNTEAYAASKGGIVALTHAMAISLGPAVRVNCISPGWINTSGGSLRRKDHVQHPVGRVGMPIDIAKLVMYLAGDESGFITGQNIVIDGGMTRRMIYEH